MVAFSTSLARILAVAALLVACEPSRAQQTSEPSPSPAASQQPTEQPIVVEVYADLVCPWCFIGTERLDQAIANSGLGKRIVIRHRPFILQPDAPLEGSDVQAYLRAKTGRDPQQAFAHVKAQAQESGIALDLSKQPRFYPTVYAHALLLNAELRGTQRALERALFRAYFIDARNIADPAVLVSIATEHGFTEAEVRRIVSDPAELTAVRNEAQAAPQRGVLGVPYFVINGERILNGAQSEQVLRAALEQAARKASP